MLHNYVNFPFYFGYLRNALNNNDIITQLELDMNSDKTCGILLLDLKKAFDTVDHKIIYRIVLINGPEIIF